MRVEGDWWVAYFAAMGTMTNALELGRVRMSIARVPAHKDATLKYYMGIVGAMISGALGAGVAWPSPPQEAPEHEKAGSA